MGPLLGNYLQREMWEFQILNFLFTCPLSCVSIQFQLAENANAFQLNYSLLNLNSIAVASKMRISFSRQFFYQSRCAFEKY